MHIDWLILIEGKINLCLHVLKSHSLFVHIYIVFLTFSFEICEVLYSHHHDQLYNV